MNKEESRFLKTSKLRKKSLRDGKLRVGPDFIRIGVSRSCNFNCVSCWNHSFFLKSEKSKGWKSLKIKKEIVFNVIDQFEKMGGTGILFSGVGEPFTHPQMMDFIKASKDKGLIVRVQTNLSLVENVLELARCSNSDLDLVCVNLSAATDKTYSLVHPNQKGKEFYNILEKVRALTKNNMPVRYVYVVNDLNYKEIPYAIELNKELGTRLHLELMDYSSRQGLSRFALNKNHKEKVLKSLLEFKEQRKHQKKGYRYIKDNLDDFIKQLFCSPLGFSDLKSCSIGYFYSIIDEAGDVFYCYGSKDEEFLLGNLSSESFKDIWSSDKYQSIRERRLRGEFSETCRSCIKKRGSNFKVRMYIRPDLRDFNLEKSLLLRKVK